MAGTADFLLAVYRGVVASIVRLTYLIQLSSSYDDTCKDMMSTSDISCLVNQSCREQRGCDNLESHRNIVHDSVR